MRIISMQKGGNMKAVFERFCDGLKKVSYVCLLFKVSNAVESRRFLHRRLLRMRSDVGGATRFLLRDGGAAEFLEDPTVGMLQSQDQRPKMEEVVLKRRAGEARMRDNPGCELDRALDDQFDHKR